MNRVTIRDIELKDSLKYIEIIRIIDCESPYMIREPGEFQKNKGDIEFEISKSHKNGTFFRVVEIDKILVGFAKLSRSTKKRLMHKAEFTIGIIKSETGKGLGSKLLEDCINWCQENGVERLDLKVAAENKAAIGLYMKYGFIKTGDYLKDIKLSPNTYLDFIHMSKF